MTDATPTNGHETVRLNVAGMHCSSCSALIEEVLADVEGVYSVDVDLEHERGAVTLDPAVVTPEEVCAVIGDLGYPATPLEEDAGA